MKNILLFIFLISPLTNLFAQMVKIPYINSNQVVGVYNIGKYAATLLNEGNRSIDQKDVYTLRFLDENTETQEIAVNQNSRLFNVETATDGSTLIFNGRNELNLVYVKPNEKPVVKVIYTADNFQYYPVFESSINPNGNMVLLRSYAEIGKDVKGRDSILQRGIEYLNLNASGDITVNRLEKRDEEMASNVVSIFPTDEGNVFLMESNSRKKDEYELKLNVCDKIGNLRGSYSLTQENTLFPSDIISDNGSLVVSGYYLNGSIFTAKKTEGLFVAILDANGNQKNLNTFDWENIKGKLKDQKSGDFLFSGKMKVLVEKIEASSSGYNIVCESYTGGSGVTVAEFLIGGNSGSEYVITVYDFVLFETNKSGELTNVSILEKEKSNIEVGGNVRNLKAIQMANTLKRYKVFPFRNMEGNQIDFVSYKQNKGYYSTLNTSTGAITEGKPILLEPEIVEKVDKDWEAMKNNSGALSKLDKLSQKAENFEKKVDEVGNKAVYGIEKIDQRFNPYEKSNSGFFILNDGKAVVYLIDPETFTLYYEYLN